MATQQVNERLAALTAAGTSVWLDQIKRSLITTGELRRLVEEESLRGVTSNPTIFNQAILGSEDYDDQLAESARAGKDTRAIYQDLAIKDIQDACDVLRVVYDQTDGADGFVSLEVDPDLAFDTDRTMEQAREYWARVDRPNLFIKIPGTVEGVPAIEEMIYEGRNINVTLLFGVEEYAAVAEAYIRGLERRHAEGKSLDVASVASFFVSRVCTEVDKRLEGTGHDELLGKAGIANARAAYQRYKEIFQGERFAALREGVEKFVEPMEKLLDGIDTKREAIVTRRPASIQAWLPDDVEPRVAERVQRAAREDVARRIWRKDDTLWGPAGQPEVANRLGWLTILDTMGEEIAGLQAFADEI